MEGELLRLPRNKILVGDARTELAKLPAASIDTVITSPPYFGLRNYGHEDQLGLEADVDGWVVQLRLVCLEIARVLKPTGSLWLNLGDGYSNHVRQGALPKSLLLGPQRLGIALALDGWIIRNQVVWAKNNPMPSSVTDRLSCTYEVLLFLVRSRYYFFDLDAVRVAPVSREGRRSARSRRRYPPAHAVPAHSTGVDLNEGLDRLKADGKVSHPLGKNPGDVWRYPTAGFSGGHFAAFPLALAERPLLATCPETTCSRCGTPWRREAVDRERTVPALGSLRPGCTCNADSTSGIVLDPFLGSGTVALAAEKHGRCWLGIELNPAYVTMAEERLQRSRRVYCRRVYCRTVATTRLNFVNRIQSAGALIDGHDVLRELRIALGDEPDVEADAVEVGAVAGTRYARRPVLGNCEFSRSWLAVLHDNTPA